MAAIWSIPGATPAPAQPSPSPSLSPSLLPSPTSTPSRPTAPLSSAVQPYPGSGPQVLTCPHCGAYDLRIRTNRGRVTYLLCNACAVTFKDARPILRTLSISP